MQNNFVKILEVSPYEGIALSASALFQEMNIESRTRESSRLMGKTMVPVIELWVDESDAEAGRKAIRDLQSHLNEESPSFCPKCDSEQMEEIPRKWWWLNPASRFRCLDCGRKWWRW